MATAEQLQLRRGTTSQTGSFTGAVGEVTVDTDKHVLVVHDGATAGGFPQVKQGDVVLVKVYTVGTLPAAATGGRIAYASDLRVFNGTGTRQGSSSGTGGLVVDNGTNWVNADAMSVTAAA